MTRCACPSTDAYHCAELRYPRLPSARPTGDGEDRAEPCDCACHDDQDAYEAGYANFLESIVGDCRCCAECWERPCGACQAGGVCDNHKCTCDDEDDCEPRDDDNDTDGCPFF